MRPKKRFLVIPLLLIFSVYLPYLLYSEVKEKTIQEHNIQQMIYARLAAGGIEHLFSRYFHELSYLAGMEEIVRVDAGGRDLLRRYYDLNRNDILAVTRVDQEGRIIHTEPPMREAVGVDISRQQHVRTIMESNKPVVSDVFTSIQGHPAVAYHVPISRGEVYRGSLAILIPFAKIAGEYLDPVRRDRGGSALLLSEEGVVLYAEKRGRIARNIRSLSASPSFVAMAEGMLGGTEGVGSYVDLRGQGSGGEKRVVHVAFSPARIGNTFWSVGVLTPEREVLATMLGFKNRWLLLLGLLLSATVVSSYLIFRSWLSAKEEEKRRRAEGALRESERNYRAVVENANSIILKWDKEGDIIYLNPFGLEFFGFSMEEVAGRNVMGTIVPENECTGRSLREMIEDIKMEPAGYKNNINQNMKKSGERVWVSWTNEPILDSEGNFVAILSIGNDLTALKKAEAALMESERKYRMVADAASDIIYEYRLDLEKATYVSPNCLEFLGYSAEELLDSGHFLGPFVSEEDAGKVRQQTIEGFKGGGSKISREYRLLCRDGSRKWVVDNATLIRDDSGRVVSVTGSIKDITEQKVLEAKLQRAQKMEAVGTLAGGVAHDLNNILSGLVSYPDLLLMGLPPDSPVRDTVRIIKKSGEKAAAIVNDLLTLARRGVSVTEVIDLNRVVGEYLDSPEHRSQRLHHPKVLIEQTLEAGPLNISGSPVHLTKTVMNLITNGLEAMPEGGTLRISTASCRVDRPVSGYDDVREGDYVVLTVTDSGHGISAEDRERIFEPFYTRKVMGRSGTGLGLAVVWGTVKDHGGFIDVQSEAGQGASFILYFPVTGEEPPVEAGEPADIDAYRGRGETVLIIDDVLEQRELAMLMLARMQYETEAVGSGEEALRAVSERSYDLLIVDMIMEPGMDGLDTYREIINVSGKQKAIIASGFSETERVREAQRLGAGCYLRKPYTLEKLARAVRRELDGA